MHTQALAWFRSQLEHLPALDVVEFGSCDMNGSVRSVYPQAKSWVGVDRRPGAGVDIQADATTWTTTDRFDVCVIAEVFEHTADWAQILNTARTVLRPGGLLVATCATGNRPAHSAIDGGALRAGEWYANVDPTDMQSVLEKQGWQFPTVEVTDGHFGADDLRIRAIR